MEAVACVTAQTDIPPTWEMGVASVLAKTDITSTEELEEVASIITVLLYRYNVNRAAKPYCIEKWQSHAGRQMF